MKTKTLIIALILSIGVFNSCTDKKKAKEETKTEVIKEETKTKIEDTTSEDEKRRLDSIRQVKEHGHAH
ncbi:hypothetical protein [Winogradskyella sp. R77965]|uniref:hypothetical protein n=1 Tax=Winogradskyella sp. R77965 TaxID=3093872 RepID=UPI0037DC1082